MSQAVLSPPRTLLLRDIGLSTGGDARVILQRWDTVGELKSAEICVSHMPSLKAKKLGKLSREKVLLEL
jgi:hypothetical protein